MTASAIAFADSDTPSLPEILGMRRAQAQAQTATYSGGMAQDTMVYWLAQAAKELREAAGRKQVHIAASMSKDQSTVYRFEQGGTVPRDLDIFVAAYADDLDVRPSEIWARGLQLWRESGEEATVAELIKARDEASLVQLPEPGSALRRRGKARSTSASSPRRPKRSQEEAN